MKRRTMIGIVGMVLAAATVFGIQQALASTPQSQPRGGPAQTTLTVVLKDHRVNTLDLAPSGPSQGDLRIVAGPLFRPTGTQPIGQAHLVCVVTDPGQQTAANPLQTECMTTFVLAGGTITSQGMHPRTALAAHALPFTDAVTGGTGAYLGARGALQGGTSGNATTYVIRLLPR